MAKSSRKWIPVERVPKFALSLILTGGWDECWFGKFNVEGYTPGPAGRKATHYIIDPDMPEEATTDE